MLVKPIKRMIRSSGGAIVLTIPRESDFKVNDVVLIKQNSESELLIKKILEKEEISDVSNDVLDISKNKGVQV